MSNQFYIISYDEGKEVFNEAMSRFADYYNMDSAEVLAYTKYLRPAAFRNELQRYAKRYGKSSDDVMTHEDVHGITLPADGRFIILVKYEKDESDTAEKIRETTYHELGHALSLYRTNRHYPNRETDLQNPPDKNTEVMLNVGNYVWQEFVAKYLALHLITADGHRVIFDMRNRADIFDELTATHHMNPNNAYCYEKLTDVFAAVLNSKIPFSEYTMPDNCEKKYPKLIEELYNKLHQHFVIDADYTADSEYTKELGYMACALLIEARKK